MPSAWLTVLAIVSLCVAMLCALLILLDILAGRHQPMAIMNVVWPVTALYLGPFAVWAYWRLGRDRASHGRKGNSEGNSAPPESRAPSDKPSWSSVFVGVTHCGAGCTLGDIVGEWMVFLLGLTLAGIALWPEFLVDYALAFALGIIFQYFAIAPMRGLGLKDGVLAAAKADTLSLTAFEIGLFGWMAFASFVLFQHQVHPNSPVYWFSMQIGMVIGFVTAMPANYWLIKRGIKEAM